jgi:hypothetical protein
LPTPDHRTHPPNTLVIFMRHKVSELLTLWRALGLVQHHDIITGDCWDRVAEDNGMRVREGVANAGAVATAAAAVLAQADGATVGEACTNFTLSPCPALWAGLESRTPTTVTFFNPLAWARNEMVRQAVSPTTTTTHHHHHHHHIVSIT